MLRTLLTAALVLSIAAPVLAAEPAEQKAEAKPASSAMKVLKNLLTGLQKSAVEGRYRRVRTSAVASVRGAGQEDTDSSKPYWKGGLSEKAAAQQRKERDQLAEAVQMALSGKTDEGSAKLDAFEQEHPKTKLKKEVAEIRARIAEIKAQGGSPDAVEAEPTEAPAQDPDKE
jgi:hypothetical protein